MGQQQLLLLVLGIVIVGLAVVVGIQAFSENQIKSNADAMVLDGVRIASDAQAWKLKPQAFGGGAGVANWTDLTFEKMGYRETDNKYVNLNGEYVLSGQATASLVITGTSEYNTVTVTVAGTGPEDITTVVAPPSD